MKTDKRVVIALVVAYFSLVLLVIGLVAPFFRIVPFARDSEAPGFDGMIEDLVAEGMKILAPGTEPTVFSLIGGIAKLVEGAAYGLALLLFSFSVVFPSVKLLVTIVTLHRYQAMSHGAKTWLKTLGPWSLLDALVVSLLVIAAKGLPMSTNIEVCSGFWIFVFSVILSWVSSAIAPSDEPKTSCSEEVLGSTEAGV